MQKEKKKFIICEAEVIDNSERRINMERFEHQVYKLKIYFCADNRRVIYDEVESEIVIEEEFSPENQFKVGDKVVIRISPFQETRSLYVVILGLVDDMPLNYKTARSSFWDELFK